MKFLGETIIRGQHFGENTFKRIPLFDGRFDTGFRIVEFKIVASNVKTANNDISGKLCTDNTANPDGAIWDWGDNREVAWASGENRVSFGPSFLTSTIDTDAMIVEDLFFTYGHVSTDSTANYYIRVQKYDFSEWEGALNIVRNSSQG